MKTPVFAVNPLHDLYSCSTFDHSPEEDSLTQNMRTTRSAAKKILRGSLHRSTNNSASPSKPLAGCLKTTLSPLRRSIRTQKNRLLKQYQPINFKGILKGSDKRKKLIAKKRVSFGKNLIKCT